MKVPSRRLRPFLGGLVLSLACACGYHPGPADQPGKAAVELAGWRVASGKVGLCDLAWRPIGGSVRRNENFEMDVTLRRDGEALPGLRLSVRGWMPDHGHGLVRAPVVTDLGDGHFRVEGMLLHMRGLWQLFFDVTDGRTADTVSFELQL